MTPCAYPYSIKPFGESQILTITLQPKSKLIVSWSMVTDLSRVHQVTRSRSKWRKFLAGELPDLRCVYTKGESGFIQLDTGLEGDIAHKRLTKGEELEISSHFFLACSPEVNLDVHFSGLFRSFFEGPFFVVKCSGEGDIWFNTSGSMAKGLGYSEGKERAARSSVPAFGGSL